MDWRAWRRRRLSGPRLGWEAEEARLFQEREQESRRREQRAVLRLEPPPGQSVQRAMAHSAPLVVAEPQAVGAPRPEQA
jgi:hypothetical protein